MSKGTSLEKGISLEVGIVNPKDEGLDYAGACGM